MAIQDYNPSDAYTLPDVGTDWLPGLGNCYVIYSIKRSTPGKPQFWSADGLGYRTIFDCGLFTKSEILGSIWRFNDGVNAVAIPLTFTALETLGFKINIDDTVLTRFLNVAGSATKPAL